eukprot:gb/GECH01012885.1/.p1 GENE.gb/GECH01012885.1/~~gb/GECH01012885.1/.p1  ORF type:complete len:723 (+),score=158.39 gb/GECH01012885.1/:1-2169(+)
MSFWKPGTKAPGSAISQDRATEDEDSVIVFNPNRKKPIHIQRENLPIAKYKREIAYLLEHHQCIIIVGHTGCGKTTQIPQFLHEFGWCNDGYSVACTQPRRVAATSVAQRVADEMQVKLGTSVGYRVRFADETDAVRTRIKYVTDGMLLNEMMMDPLLTAYSVIIVDEAHERSLYTDVILGLLKKILKRRPELRLIVSSATIEASEFQRFFTLKPAKASSLDPRPFIMSIEGRAFPVEVYYTETPVASYVSAAAACIVDIHRRHRMKRGGEGSGDILAFLPGQDDIEKVIELIQQYQNEDDQLLNLDVLPMHASLPHHDQVQAFLSPQRGHRKAVIATNIAETSITIPGITFVVDSGFVKVKTYDPRTDVERLVVTEESQASANQRAGRAGRLRPGKCYRLFPETEYEKLSPHAVPEIQRSNLMNVLLQLKSLGIDDVLHFDFMSPPPSETMIRGLELLYCLGALDDYAKLTHPTGYAISEFPVNPMIAKMLLASGEYGCSEEMLTISAMLSVTSVWHASRHTQRKAEKARRFFAVAEGDHLTYLNVYKSFIAKNKSSSWCGQYSINYKTMLRAMQIRRQLRQYLKRFHITLTAALDSSPTVVSKPVRSKDGEETSRMEHEVIQPEEKIRRCVVTGYFSHAARRNSDGSYATLRGDQVLYIHPSSAVFKHPPEWVVYHEVVETNKQYMRDVMAVKPDWLAEIAPHFYEFRSAKDPKAIEKNL